MIDACMRVRVRAAAHAPCLCLQHPPSAAGVRVLSLDKNKAPSSHATPEQIDDLTMASAAASAAAASVAATDSDRRGPLPSSLGFPVDVLAQVKPSTVRDAGLGLFALRDLPKGTRVTWYDGAVLDRTQAAVVAATDPSFLRSVSFDEVIDGLRRPLAGRGAASFANHGARAALRNADLKALWDRAHHATRIVLVTTQAVRAGEELLVNYGAQYWARLGVEPH